MPDEIILTTARQYAATLGWKLIPLHASGPRAKRPRGSRWPDRATSDVTRIENWHASYADDPEGIAFGIVTGEGSGVFVVDVDDDTTGWTDLLTDHEPLPDTVMARTGSGGTHLYFAYPDGKVISSGTGVPVKGIDIRADGGQCVLPPAPHPSGNRYEWVNDPFEIGIADCPDWLLKLIREKTGAEDFLPLDAVWDERQNDHLYHYARTLIFADWSPDEVREQMMKKWRAGEIPNLDKHNPWTKSTILEPVESGIKQASDQVEVEVPTGGSNGRERLRLRFGSPLGLTDEDNALRLAKYFEDRLLYAPKVGWHVWDEQRWRHDPESLLVGRLAERTTRRIQAEANLQGGKNAERLRRWAKASRNVSRISAMVSLARKQDTVLADREDLDSTRVAEWFNVANGTLNLRTLELRDPDPADLITKVSPTAWDPEAQCPEWLRTLGYAFDGDERMVDFMQRALGYSLTGLVPEFLFIAWGATGLNAKSTLMENFYGAVGQDYGKSFSASAVMDSRNENFTLSTLAQMRGSRFATASETGEDDFLNEDLVKAVTGGDTLTCKYMRQDSFEYRPSFKVWVRTNNRPKVRSDTDPIWRRLVLIPFTSQVPPEARRPRYEVDEMLAAEHEGILAWAIRGAQQFFERGLEMPPSVVSATERYRADNDPIGGFVREQCELGPEKSCFRSEFKRQFDDWCREQFNWRKGPSTMKVSEYLQARMGVELGGSGGNTTYEGVGLIELDDDWDGTGA